MKKISTILITMLLLTLMLSGCGKDVKKTMSITLNVDTGDSVKLTLDTSEDNKIAFDKETSIINISDAEDNIVLQGIFVPQNSYSLYYETAYTDNRCDIISTGKGYGLSYTYYTYNDGNNINCEYIGWIIGTNSGVVFESTTLSTDDCWDLLEKLSFSVSKTEQVNEEYAYEPSIQTTSQLNPEGNQPSESESQETENAPTETPTETSLPESQFVNWTTTTIKIDGVSYQFPYSYKTLQANGWDFNINDYLEEGETEYLLDEGEYTYSTTQLRNEKYGNDMDSACIYVGFKNFTENQKNIIDCDLWAIEVSGVYGTKACDKCPDVELPGGIKFGATYEEIIATYGDPAREDNKDYYIQLDYENFNDNGSQYMTLYIYNGDGDKSANGLLDAEFRCY